MYCTGNNIYDKQVQGGSVHIIEPGTLCVKFLMCLPKTKSVVCKVLKEGKIKCIETQNVTQGQALEGAVCIALGVLHPG